MMLKFPTGKNKGPTRIRTGVGRIRTASDDHYTIRPCYLLFFQVENASLNVSNFQISNIVIWIAFIYQGISEGVRFMKMAKCDDYRIAICADLQDN